MSNVSPSMTAWKKFSQLPAGKWLFSRALCWKAPYFSTISPHFTKLRPGYCKLVVKKKRNILITSEQFTQLQCVTWPNWQVEQ